MSAEIEFDAVEIRYGSTVVIPKVDLTVRAGEFLTLLGPSGCGKSTLLRAVAGFVATHSGSIRVGGRDLTHVEPEHRGVGMVFQNYALFPHLTVRRNVEFGLRIAGVGRTEITERVDRVLEVSGLERYADRYPAQLSGGQQQRVAIARVLATEPAVLLMDEPLSNLDAGLRASMRDELQRLHRELGVTTLYVTHDQEEALALSDRLAVVQGGEIVQLGTPRELYAAPADSRVARFVGAMNVLEPAAASAFGLNGAGVCGVRGELLQVGRRDLPFVADASVVATAFLGPLTRYRLQVADQTLFALVPGSLPVIEPGTATTVGFTDADLVRMPA